MKQKHPIFKAVVFVTNQEECDVARRICEENELPMWRDVKEAFRYVDYDDDYTYVKYQGDVEKDNIGFFVDFISEDEIDEYTIISMEEFEELARNYSYKDLSLKELKQKFEEVIKK
jgi:hypothetical protein